MKVAIPVESDGKKLAIRMGHAPHFSVHQIEGDRIQDLGLHENPHSGRHQGGQEDHHHGHGEHQANAGDVAEHRRDLGIVKDCDAVIVRGIGPNMQAALLAENIVIYRARKALGETTDAVLRAFRDTPGAFDRIQ